MVTDAQWADLDGDGKKELIVVGDWMPVTVFAICKWQPAKKTELPHSSGWWNCLSVADIDGDGKPDLVAGNFGSELKYQSRSRTSRQNCTWMISTGTGKQNVYPCIINRMGNHIPIT
jgi:hypothetical protein